MTIEEQIENKKIEVSRSAKAHSKLEKELTALKVQLMESKNLSPWDKLVHWAENKIGINHYNVIQHFPIAIESPEGFPSEVEMDRHLYAVDSYGEYQPFAYDGEGRGSIIDVFHLVLEPWSEFRDDIIDGITKPYWKIRMDHAYMTANRIEYSSPEAEIKIPFTLEHLDQFAEYIMDKDMKSYTFDW